MTPQPPTDEFEPRARRAEFEERRNGQHRLPGQPGGAAPGGAAYASEIYGNDAAQADPYGTGAYRRSRVYGNGRAPADADGNGRVYGNGRAPADADGNGHGPAMVRSDGRGRAESVAVLAEADRAQAPEPEARPDPALPEPVVTAVPAPPPVARRLSAGLPLVLLLQACISLSLMLSNTAFSDEANYLWVGRLELANWFSGAPTPHFDVLSGASVLYPPLGALASYLGGLTGARILSLLFMLGATTLLYSAAERLFGRRPALAAAALWAVSVSALKLGAFATYDPMATFLICLSAWLIVQASFRRRAPELAILAALAMLIGDLTAYSYAIYDPALIAFALVVWRARLGRRRAWQLQGWLLGSAVTFGFVIPTALGLWSAIVAVTLTRSGNTANEAQGYVLTAQLAWEWSGLVAVLALAGAIAGFAAREDKHLRVVLAVLAGSAFLVPVYQLHLQTGWALDKHLSCGIWLAAMAAGYLIAKIPVPAGRRGVMALAGVGALAFPLVSGWMSAYSDFQSWQNATALVARLKPLVTARAAGGLFTGSSSNWLLDFYTGSVDHGPQWGTGPQISLNPASLPPNSAWQVFYGQQLERSQYQYGVIALEYPVATSAFGVPPGSSDRPDRSVLRADLATLTSENGSLATLDAFAAAVDSDPNYQLVGAVAYSDDLGPGSYLIWKRI